MFARLRAAAWASAVIAIAPPAHAQLPTITDYTKSFEKRDGYFTLYWDGAKGRLLVEIPAGRGGAGQGSYQLDRDRSAIYLPRTKGFPENTEIEASRTFTTDQPGRRARQHAPDARAITLRQHLSLVKLPGPGFRPRKFDPRVGI